MASEEKLYNVNKTIKGKTVSVLNDEVCLDIDMDSINANKIGQITANPGGTYIDFLDSQGFISPEYVLYKQDSGNDFTELPAYLNGDISGNPYLSYVHNGTTVYAYNNFHQYTQDGLSCYANEEDLSQEAKNCLAEIFAGDNNFMNFLYSISTASSSEIENIITNVYGLEFLSNLFSSYTLISGYYGFNLSNNGYVAVSFVDAFNARVENYTNQNDKYEADISIGVDPETGDITLSVTVSEIEEAFGSHVYTDYFWTCTSENGTYYIGRVKVDGLPQSDSPVVNNYIDAATPYIDDYKADNANWVQTNVMPNVLDYDAFTLNNITFSRKGNSEEIVATMDILNGFASDSIIVDSVSIDIVSGEDIYTVNFSGDGSEILAGNFGTVTGTSSDVALLTISGVSCNVTDFQYQEIVPELRTNVIDNISVTDNDWELTSVTIVENEPYAADGYCDAYLINNSVRKRQFEGVTINFDNSASIYLEALDFDFEAGEGNTVGQPSSGVELDDMLSATGVTSISVNYNDLYYLTFDTDGGSYVEPQEVRSGEMGYEPEPPTKEGYTFGGWYDDNSYAVPFDFDAPIYNDVTAYALWEPNPLTLTEGLSLCAPFKEISERMDSYIPIEYKELHYDVGSDYPFIVSFASGSNGELLYLSADAGSLKIMLYDGSESRELHSVAFSSPTQETYVTLEEIIGSLYDLPDRFLPRYSGNDIVFTNIFDIEVRDPLNWLNVAYTTTNTEPNIYGEWVSITLESGDTLYVQPYIGNLVTSMIVDDPQYYNVEYPMGQQDSPCVFIIAKGNNGAYIGVSVGIDTFDLKLYDGYNLETLGSVTIASPEGSNATLDELCSDFSGFDINPYTYSGSEPITFTILDTIYIYSDTSLTPYKTLINHENNIIVSKPTSEPINLSNGSMFDIDFTGIQEVLEDGLFGSLGNDTHYMVSFSSPLMALYFARGTDSYVGIGIQDSKYKVIVYDGVNSNVINEVTIPNLIGSDVTLSQVIQDLSLFGTSVSMTYLGESISLDRLNIIEVWLSGYGDASNLQNFIRNNNNVYLSE